MFPALAAHAGVHTHDDHDGHEATVDGIEWEDDMVEVNRMTTPATAFQRISFSAGSWYERPVVGQTRNIRLTAIVDPLIWP